MFCISDSAECSLSACCYPLLSNILIGVFLFVGCVVVVGWLIGLGWWCFVMFFHLSSLVAYTVQKRLC